MALVHLFDSGAEALDMPCAVALGTVIHLHLLNKVTEAMTVSPEVAHLVVPSSIS
jgi:hypothetical protein